MRRDEAIPYIGPFTQIRQFLNVYSPVRAAKLGKDIVAVSIDVVDGAIVNRLVAPQGVYNLPDVCHILVADGNVYAAGRGSGGYAFVLPPGVTKPVFGARGVYERGGQVWYKPAPGENAINLFPAPLLFLESRNGIVIAASHYNYAVISSGNVYSGEAKLPIASVGITGDTWYITKVAEKNAVIVQTDDGEIARVPRINAIMVGDIIIGYGVEDTILICGSYKERGAPMHLARGLDDSFLVIEQNWVFEIAKG